MQFSLLSMKMPALARSVCERDDIIDGLQTQIFRELVTFHDF